MAIDQGSRPCGRRQALVYILHVKNRFVLRSTRRPAVCHGAFQYVCATRTPEQEPCHQHVTVHPPRLSSKIASQTHPAPPPSHTNNRHPAHHPARTNLPPTTQQYSTLPSPSSIASRPPQHHLLHIRRRSATSDGHVPLVQRTGPQDGQLLRRWAGLLG